MTLLRLTDTRPDEPIEKLLQSLIDEAETEWKPSQYEGWYPSKGFGIAELAPYHCHAGGTTWLSSDYWGASIAASNTWQDWMNHTQTDMAYVMATGFFDLEPNPIVTALRPNPGGEDLPVMNIEQAFALDLARAYFENPWAVKPNSPFKLRIKGNDAGTERIGLVGYCIGKRAFLINEV